VKSSASKNPIAAYSIPSQAPPAVARAYETFNRVGDTWAATLVELEEARASQKAAVAEAQRSVIDAAKAGKSSRRDPVAVAEECEAKINDLIAKRAALAVAVDETGNDLAIAISQSKSEWIESLETFREEASARFERALADVRAALRDYAPARRAVEWVSEFQHGPATVGLVPGFAGGQIRVRDAEYARGPNAEPVDPFKLLDILATATAPQEVASPRAHVLALGSSMS
jgi:hypothetical protein